MYLHLHIYIYIYIYMYVCIYSHTPVGLSTLAKEVMVATSVKQSYSNELSSR